MDLIRFIFACFCIFANTIYSHHSLHIRFKIFAQIRKQMFDLMQNNTRCSEYSLMIFSYWRIFASKYSPRSNYPRNLSEFHIQRIFACKYSHTSEYPLRIASNYLAKPFTSLNLIIFGSFWKYSLRNEYRFYSFRMKNPPICFDAKQANKYSLHICLHSLRTEYRGAPY